MSRRRVTFTFINRLTNRLDTINGWANSESAELAVHRSLDAMDAGAYVISHRRTGFLVGLAELRFNTVGEALRVAEKLESSYHWRKLKPNGLSAPTGWPKSTARRQQLRKLFASAAMWP